MSENRNQMFIRLVMAVFAVHIFLGMWFVERGLINADEGWYLYAARQIAAGSIPYLDFGLFQPPVYPTALAGMVDSGPGALLAARWISWFGLAAGTGATVLAAVRLVGVGGGLIAAVGLALHPVVLNHGVLAKPYGLTVLLLGTGLLLMTSERHRAWRTAIGFFLMALAVGTRLSLLAPVLILWIWQPARGVAGLGLACGIGLAFHRAVGVDPNSIVDQWLGFHLGDGGSLRARLGWSIHVLTVWLVAAVAWVPGPRSNRLPGLLPASCAAVAVHALPAALHVEHLVAVSPLLLLATADRWGREILRPRVAALGLSIAAFGTWMARPFVHLDSTVASVRQTMELGAWVAKHTPSSKPLLTVQLAVAVEADRSVLSGLEMARFGWSPDLTVDEARNSHRMSAARLVSELQRPIGGVIVADGDFDAERRALIEEAARQHFGRQRTVSAYGQFAETVNLYVPDGGTLWMR